MITKNSVSVTVAHKSLRNAKQLVSHLRLWGAKVLKASNKHVVVDLTRCGKIRNKKAMLRYIANAFSIVSGKNVSGLAVSNGVFHSREMDLLAKKLTSVYNAVHHKISNEDEQEASQVVVVFADENKEITATQAEIITTVTTETAEAAEAVSAEIVEGVNAGVVDEVTEDDTGDDTGDGIDFSGIGDIVDDEDEDEDEGDDDKDKKAVQSSWRIKKVTKRVS